jgi:hypothetical protein
MPADSGALGFGEPVPTFSVAAMAGPPVAEHGALVVGAVALASAGRRPDWPACRR